MGDMTTTRRHYADRPMEKLTIEELMAITELQGIAGLLRDTLADRLGVLADLAEQEMAGREMKATLEGGTG